MLNLHNVLRITSITFLLMLTACPQKLDVSPDPQSGKPVVTVGAGAKCEVGDFELFTTQTMQEGKTFPFKCWSDGTADVNLVISFNGPVCVTAPDDRIEAEREYRGVKLTLKKSVDGKKYEEVQSIGPNSDIGPYAARLAYVHLHNERFNVNLKAGSTYYGQIVLEQCRWGSSRECSFDGIEYGIKLAP